LGGIIIAASFNDMFIKREGFMNNKNESVENQTADQPIPFENKPILKIVKNLTARRIGINSTSEKSGDRLIIPPFGSLILDAIVLNNFSEINSWVKHNLIKVEEKKIKSESDASFTIAGCLIMLFILFLLITIPIGIFSKFSLRWSIVGFGTLVFIIPILIIIFSSITPKKDEEDKKDVSVPYLQWFSLLPSLLLTLLFGIGLPFLVIFFFGGGQLILSQAFNNDNIFIIGRSMQLGFISIASTLPALMFFMFGRQQIQKARDNFIREVMMLDPNIQTTSEAEIKYDPLFESVYGIGKTPLDSIPIYICTILITLGWILTLLPIGQNMIINEPNLITYLTPNATAINFGFLGAYFFTINMVYRRYVRSDLTTKTYTYISIRFLITFILVWAISSIPGLINLKNVAESTGIFIISFLIGIFPETGIALMQDFYKKAFGKIIKSLDEEHPLTNLEGINLYDRARLLEEGIENIENLAHHNLIELLAKTRIPTTRIIDMFDQAILYIHLGLKAPELLAVRQQLRTYGIRTATDLQQIKEKYLDILKDVSPNFDNKLRVIECALSDDEWMEYLKQWKSSTRSDTYYTLEEFYNNRPKISQIKENVIKA
jgi:hypothetical protein